MSQFTSLFQTDTKEKKETKPKTKREKKKPDTSLSPAVKTSPKAVAGKHTTGKSSNAAYTQVLAYVRRDTHNAVKAALIFDVAKRDLSDLVEELLSGWLKDNPR